MNSEKKADVKDMMEAREERARCQEELLASCSLPVVSFTMNIAGPVKNGSGIRRAFALGERRLKALTEIKGIRLVEEKKKDSFTGCEGLYVFKAGAQELKELCCSIEEGSELGRLFDLDVIDEGGRKLERKAARKCLICGRPAKECTRNRTHSAEELKRKADSIIEEAITNEDAARFSALAQRSLLFELAVSPKPGLVDRFNSGSHKDMDFYTLLSSVSVLFPYFSECFKIGRRTAKGGHKETFAALKYQGLIAEAEMMRASGGVNTHKGAIFSLGLVLGALGRIDEGDRGNPALVLSEAARLAREASAPHRGGSESKAAFNEQSEAGKNETAGERFFRLYGIRGIRGEAEQGFPTVLNYGLPLLRQGLKAGKSTDEAGAAALLKMLSKAEDTNMIKRGGRERAKELSLEIAALLKEEAYPAEKELSELDRLFISENLSPGGSADLLALSFMLYFLESEG